MAYFPSQRASVLFGCRKLHCSVTEAHVCKQHARSHCVSVNLFSKKQVLQTSNSPMKNINMLFQSTVISHFQRFYQVQNNEQILLVYFIWQNYRTKYPTRTIYLGKEHQMFTDSQRIKEHIVLRTEAKVFTDVYHIPPQIKSIDVGCSSTRRQKTCSYTGI